MTYQANLKFSKDNRLAEKEPEFFDLWIKTMVNPEDPQIERWMELASMQIEEGQRNIEHLKTFVDVEGKTILDLGCQCGHNSIALTKAGANVIGVDLQNTYVAGAKVRAKCNDVSAGFVAGMGESLPFRGETFDVVYCLNVIEHVANQNLAVREMVRVLKKGGVLYLDGPNRFSPHWLKKDPHYQMRFISILPRFLSKFYVTKVRGYPAYEVGHFPVASLIEGKLCKLGMLILYSSHPNSIRQISNNSMSLKNMPRPAENFLDWIKFNVSPMLHFFCRKPGGAVEVDFASYRVADNYVISGFSHYEGPQRWLDGLEAHIRIPPPDLSTGYSDLSIELFPFIHTSAPYQTMEVLTNGESLGTAVIRRETWQKISFRISRGYTAGIDWVEFTLITPNAISPKNLGISQDSRNLSFLVRKIIIS